MYHLYIFLKRVHSEVISNHKPKLVVPSKKLVVPLQEVEPKVFRYDSEHCLFGQFSQNSIYIFFHGYVINQLSNWLISEVMVPNPKQIS